MSLLRTSAGVMALAAMFATFAAADPLASKNCPDESNVLRSLGWAASAQNPGGIDGTSSVKVIARSGASPHRCIFSATHEYGSSAAARHEATRLVVWDSRRGFLGAYSIEDVNFYPDGVGGFRYVDSSGHWQGLNLTAGKIPDKIWFDGEIRLLQPVPQPRGTSPAKRHRRTTPRE